MKKWIALSATIFLSGCTTTEYVSTIIPVVILPMPELPKLTPEQQLALDDLTYRILVRRDVTLTEHIKNQRELIELHNRAKKSTN